MPNPKPLKLPPTPAERRKQIREFAELELQALSLAENKLIPLVTACAELATNLPPKRLDEICAELLRLRLLPRDYCSGKREYSGTTPQERLIRDVRRAIVHDRIKHGRMVPLVGLAEFAGLSLETVRGLCYGDSPQLDLETRGLVSSESAAAWLKSRAAKEKP
jgi:hypothetical protein